MSFPKALFAALRVLLGQIDLDRHLRGDARVKPYGNLVIARRADGFHFNAALFYLHAVLLIERVGNLLRCHGAIQTAAFSAARRHTDNAALELAGKRLGFRTADAFAVRLGFLGLVDRVERGRSRFNRELLGEKEIAGVTVGSLNNLILLTGTLYILEQNNLPQKSSSCSSSSWLSSSGDLRRWRKSKY